MKVKIMNPSRNMQLRSQLLDQNSKKKLKVMNNSNMKSSYIKFSKASVSYFFTQLVLLSYFIMDMKNKNYLWLYNFSVTPFKTSFKCGTALQNTSHKKFSISTAFYIAIELINRLQSIHCKGFIHRDIKANNFMITKKDLTKTIYVIDFGLTKRYKDVKTGLHIPMKSGKSLVGTARYASIASHDGNEQCRRDDLQSVGYMILYFIRGKLPWQGIQIENKIQKYKEIGRMKKEASISNLCQQINPSACKKSQYLGALVKYFDIVKGLGFEEQPNYQLLRKTFQEQLIKKNEHNKPLDWQCYIFGQKKQIIQK